MPFTTVICFFHHNRHLQERLEEPVSEPPSPKELDDPNDLTIKTMTSKIRSLRDEVRRLRGQLLASEKERTFNMLLLHVKLIIPHVIDKHFFD